MPDLLGDGGTAAALRALPDWTGDGAEIRRTVDLPDFPTAIDVVGAVAAEAERRDHHPDIDIRWRTLTFACATHSEGGVTSLDVDLATEIDRIVAPRVAGDGPAR